MALIINHNLLAMSTARTLGGIYGRLAESTERLSSGLRINSAADDTGGLAVREYMRAEIAVLGQGLRNASDAVAMIQTGEGALSTIDEKLIRMKELAEQAATSTYTTTQREILNSEYQTMASEIDRIANSTDFNSIKLLDGSLQYQRQGKGLCIHFGPGNDEAEDYAYLKVEDVRATEKTGLRVGGDAQNDIWGQGGLTNFAGIGSYNSLTLPLTGVSGKTFSYAYNYDANMEMDPNGTGSGGLVSHFSYLGGLYRFQSGDSLEDLVNKINQGTQSRVKINFTGDVSASTWSLGSGAVNINLGNEVYQFIEGAVASAYDSGKDVFKVLDTTVLAGSALVKAINQSSLSFWAVKQGNQVYVFHKNGGNYDSLSAFEQGLGASGAAAASAYVNWQNMETYQTDSSGVAFGLGGEYWATASAIEGRPDSWSLRLQGRDVGDRFDLVIGHAGSGADYSIDLSGLGFDSGVETLEGLRPIDFAELQDAADAPWKGAEIRTQSSAAEALEAITQAILKKDKNLADLGALHNKLESTIVHLTLLSDELLQAEARISDVDVALEVTEFTKQNILAQAATAILAQANVMHSLALALIV